MVASIYVTTVTMVKSTLIARFDKYLILSYIDGLVQERRNSIAKALGLRLSCTNPSI